MTDVIDAHFLNNVNLQNRLMMRAKNGWCLFELGCKGPETFNACATVKWNQGTSFPIESGHPCLGYSEPDFWDKSSFYQALVMGVVQIKPAKVHEAYELLR